MQNKNKKLRSCVPIGETKEVSNSSTQWHLSGLYPLDSLSVKTPYLFADI